MSVYIRTKVESTGPGGLPVNSTSIHRVLGWQPIDAEGNDSMSEEEYILRYGEVGNYILEIKGQVVEEEIFEDKIVHGFVVGHMYSDHRGFMQQCAFKVEGKDQWGFESGDGYIVVCAQGKLLRGVANKPSIYPHAKRVSLGKKKVLKPYVP